MELESKNKKLSEDLAAAEAKMVVAVGTSGKVDERAVLKHFKWSEKKADAMQEAAVEYQELKLLEQEISSYMDDPDIPCGAALEKMASLLDKSELSIQRLIKLRNSVMRSYQAYTFQPLACSIRG